MGLACKITGHKWNGCVCVRCGERRDEGHSYQLDAERSARSGQCVVVCSICGASKSHPHEWSGCTCLRCGARRDEEHLWQGCRCAACGKARDEGHEWGEAKPWGHANHYRPCTICGKCKDEPHLFELVKSRKCYYRCTACGYGVEWHEFRDGVCMNCGIDESRHYCDLILSGVVWHFDDWEYSPLDGSSIRYIDHVKSVADLRRLALSDRGGIGDADREGFACRIGEIAEAGGPDAHEANLALRDIVLNTSLGWSVSSVVKLITEPEIASDPKIVEKLRQMGQSRYEFERAMIAADSGRPW